MNQNINGTTVLGLKISTVVLRKVAESRLYLQIEHFSISTFTFSSHLTDITLGGTAMLYTIGLAFQYC